MIKFYIKIFLLILPAIFVNGQSFTGSAAFLKRGVSARAIGMGSAYTAIADDPSACYWNPAGLLGGSKWKLQLSDLQDDIGNMGSFGDINSPQFAFSYSHKKPLPLLNTIYWACGISANGFFSKTKVLHF